MLVRLGPLDLLIKGMGVPEKRSGRTESKKKTQSDRFLGRTKGRRFKSARGEAETIERSEDTGSSKKMLVRLGPLDLPIKSMGSPKNDREGRKVRRKRRAIVFWGGQKVAGSSPREAKPKPKPSSAAKIPVDPRSPKRTPVRLGLLFALFYFLRRTNFSLRRVNISMSSGS